MLAVVTKTMIHFIRFFNPNLENKDYYLHKMQFEVVVFPFCDTFFVIVVI